VNKKTVSDMAVSGSTMVEHSPHYPMVEGVGTITAVGTRREGKDIQIL
jgi:hypothetical protein